MFIINIHLLHLLLLNGGSQALLFNVFHIFKQFFYLLHWQLCKSISLLNNKSNFANSFASYTLQIHLPLHLLLSRQLCKKISSEILCFLASLHGSTILTMCQRHSYGSEFGIRLFVISLKFLRPFFCFKDNIPAKNYNMYYYTHSLFSLQITNLQSFFIHSE